MPVGFRSWYHSFLLSSLVVIATLLFLCWSSIQVTAQDLPSGGDSLAMEELVATSGRQDFISNARSLLRRRIERYERGEGRALLDFMVRRSGATGWLAPEEELLAHLLLTDTARLLDPLWLEPPLQQRLFRSGPHGTISDDLYIRLLERLRRGREDILHRLASKKSEMEERFLELLVNGLATKGVRKTGEYNGMVKEFIRTYPSSPFAPLARRYLYLETEQATVGAGLFAGYASGGMLSSGEGGAGRLSGASFSGELYVSHALLSGTLFAGTLDLSDSFAVASDTWSNGSASLTGFSLDAGYEFRFGNLMLTPFIGGTLYELREPREVDPESRKALSTGGMFGYEGGVIIGQRIPFDIPPHIDLRLRLSLVAPRLGDFNEALRGTAFLATHSFGHVQRPYTTLPAAANGG